MIARLYAAAILIGALLAGIAIALVVRGHLDGAVILALVIALITSAALLTLLELENRP